MTDHTKPPTTAAALLGLALTAPLSPQGQCFGLIPAGGDWLDDLIDWLRRQFKRPEDAQRIVFSWNRLRHVPLDALIEPNSQAAALRAALTACNQQGMVTAVAPAGFADAVICLKKAFDALESTADSDLDHFEDEEEEAEAAPMQFAARKIARALELLYGYGLDAAPQPAPTLAQPCASKYATLPEYSTAMAAWRVQRAAAAGGPTVCNVAPPGWHCTRLPGHCGPCAAIPVNAPGDETGGTQ